MYYALSILHLKMKNFLKHKTTLVIIFVLPVLFTFFVSFQSKPQNKKYVIVVVDNARNQCSRQIINSIKSNNIKIEIAEESKAKRIIYNLDAEVAYVIPKNIDKSIRNNNKVIIKNYYLKKSQIAPVINSIVADDINKLYIQSNIAMITSKIMGSSKDYNKIRFDIQKLTNRTKIAQVKVKNVNVNSQEKDDLSSASQGSMGFTVFFVMFALVYSVGTMVDDRKYGTFYRIGITPASKASILSGYMLSSFVQGIIQFTFLILCGVYIFNVNWGSSIPGVVMVMVSYIISVSCMGLIIASLVETTSQLNAIAPLIMIATSMIGGCYWSLDVASKPFRVLAKFVPQGWAMIGLNDMVLRNKGMQAAIQPSIMMILMGAAFFLVGIRNVKFNMN